MTRSTGATACSISADLGATACTFHRDYYGELPDELNAGWPSDRLTVDWRLRSPDILQDADSPRKAAAWDVDEMDAPAAAK